MYESIRDNVNSRVCFSEDLDNTPEYYRYVWNMEGEKKSRANFYNGNYTEDQWKENWGILQTTNTYELDYFGDLAIHACAHSLKKDILLINTPWQTQNAFANEPINVIPSDTFDPSNQKNNDVPQQNYFHTGTLH